MVRPIDLQDNLAKTQAAERMNQIQKSHGEVGQQQVAGALKEKAAAEMERTRAAEKTDMLVIRSSKEEEEKEKEKKRRQKEEERQNQSSQRDHIDLKG